MKNFTIALAFVLSFAIIIGLAVSAVGNTYSYESKIDQFEKNTMKADSIEHAIFMEQMTK